MNEIQVSPELKAIQDVAAQVAQYKTDLGNKADLAHFKGLEEQIKTLKESLATGSEKTVTQLIKDINTATEKLATQVGEMKEEQNRIKDGGKAIMKAGELFDPADVQKFIDTVFPDKGSKKKSHDMATIKLNRDIVLVPGGRNKAAEIMGYPQFFEGVDGVTTDWTAFTGRVVDPRLYERRRKRNFILDNFNIPSIAAPTLLYMEKIEVAGDDASQEDSGSAEWITSGEQKPMRSFRVTSNKVEAKKIAIFGTVEDKLLRDVPSLENWIRTDFTAEMREGYNDGLLNNDPDVDEDAPLGLKINAVQYSDVSGFVIANPTNIDAIIAAIAQMANANEEAEFAVVSPRSYYAMLALKDSQQRYQNSNLVYSNSLGQLFIAGVRLVMADVNDIPDANFMVIGADGFQIRNYGPLVFERGLNGEDFRYDRTSFRAYQEVLSYIPSHRYGSVIYDTFANVKTAIAS